MIRRERSTRRLAWLVQAALLLAVCWTPAWGEWHRHGSGSDDGLHRILVVDAITGQPIAGAQLRWWIDGAVQTGGTDQYGRATLMVPAGGHGGGDGDGERAPGDDGRSGHGGDHAHPDVHGSAGGVPLEASANLYRSAWRELAGDGDAHGVMRIGLHPRPADRVATVGGTVVDGDSGGAVGGARVELLGAGGVLQTTSDPQGAFSFTAVGYSRELRIRITVSDPPCMATLDQPLIVNRPAMTARYALNPTHLPIIHCHFDGTYGPFGTGPVGTGPAGGGLPTDRAIQWHQADINSILIDADRDAWHSGHINAILKFEPEGGMAAAADTGGVWAITSIAQAIPLSSTWPTTSMMALVAGPDSARHAYAATYADYSSFPFGGGTLYETDTSDPLTLLAWKSVTNKPPCTSINGVLVIPDTRRIVLACSEGVFWSAIPPAPSAHGTYNWINATPSNLQAGSAFASVALGPGWDGPSTEGTIVAAKWGGYAPGAAIYHGSWVGGVLTWSYSNVDQGNFNLFLSTGRTSLASCPGDRSQMYAVADDGANNFAAVWRSSDGGASFTQVSPPSNPGVQGQYNNAIAVSGDCRIVALGWQAGTFVSYDHGGSWNLLNAPYHGHGDVHALTFDPYDPATLYVGSDGGILSASGLAPGATPTYASNWNRALFDLQFYHAAASPAAAGLVGAGAQDNGVLAAGLPGPWQHISDCGCDGRWAVFIAPPDLAAGNSLLLEEEWGAPDWPFGWVQANGNSVPFQAQQNIPLGSGSSNVLTNVVTQAVRSPGGFSNANGEVMYAAAGSGATAYGLFANSDGTDLHWEVIGSIDSNQHISAVAPTFNGQSVFLGTGEGRLYRLDPGSSSSGIQLAITAPAGTSGSGSVSSVVAFFSTIADATINYGGSGYVMHWNGSSWTAVAGTLPNDQPFSAITGTGIDTLYVTTGTAVYDTQDGGNTWAIANTGLPAQYRTGTELFSVLQPDGTRYLYLATYGRSLFRAQLP